MNTETSSNPAPAETPVAETKWKFPKISLKAAIVLAVIVILILLAVVYRGLFVAATVDGQPISRFAVIKELEKQSGQQALDSLINEKLINNEAKAKNVTVSDEEIDSEVRKVEDELKEQGTSLEDELTAQNVSRGDFERQIKIQVLAEKLLGDKITVSDDELNKYITDNEIAIPQGEEQALREQVRDQLKGQKFGQNVATWLQELKDKAKINTYVNY
jgi:foldase protein PrsA